MLYRLFVIGTYNIYNFFLHFIGRFLYREKCTDFLTLFLNLLLIPLKMYANILSQFYNHASLLMWLLYFLHIKTHYFEINM